MKCDIFLSLPSPLNISLYPMSSLPLAYCLEKQITITRWCAYILVSEGGLVIYFSFAQRLLLVKISPCQSQFQDGCWKNISPQEK